MKMGEEMGYCQRGFWGWDVFLGETMNDIRMGGVLRGRGGVAVIGAGWLIA